MKNYESSYSKTFGSSFGKSQNTAPAAKRKVSDPNLHRQEALNKSRQEAVSRRIDSERKTQNSRRTEADDASRRSEISQKR